MNLPKRLIPVTAPIAWQPPLEAYQKIHQPNSFLLESVSGPLRVARYSLIGIEPHTIFSAKGSKVTITSSGFKRLVTGDPFEALRETLGSFAHGADQPFHGLAAGYFGYDLAGFIERLPNLATDDLNVPDAVFLFCRLFIVFDHGTQRAEAIALVDESGGSERTHGRGLERIDALVQKLKAPTAPIASGPGGKPITWTSNFSEADFRRAVVAAKEYITAGDIYQVNLSQRLSAPTQSPPLAIYSILRQVNPSPFAGFFDFGDWQLVGCSPERLVKLQDRFVQTRPIAGTIKRGQTDSEDDDLRARLTADVKERAEHIMLVDLERNDLGRVCDYGSVKVDELTITESYSHVTHIVSNVVGQLNAARDGFDLIRACFPGGTITGCPKVRAMEIIEELEPVKRGPYTGSMGYLSFNGDVDLNIIIRTLLIKEGLAHVQAGAGIVADSDPGREYLETLYKAEALVRAATLAEEGRGC
jgi:anthranilate/para-aminobenzoate synthase component I